VILSDIRIQVDFNSVQQTYSIKFILPDMTREQMEEFSPLYEKIKKGIENALVSEKS
jgi:hypothetical protein